MIYITNGWVAWIVLDESIADCFRYGGYRAPEGWTWHEADYPLSRKVWEHGTFGEMRKIQRRKRKVRG